MGEMNWNRKPPKKSHPLRLNKSLLNGVPFKQWTALQYNQRPRFSLDQIKTTTAVFFIFLTSSFFKPKSTDNKRPTADQINWTLERISQNFPYFSVPSFTFTTLTKKKKKFFLSVKRYGLLRDRMACTHAKLFNRERVFFIPI